MKDVSVIIPVYNRPEKVCRAIESVKRQTKFDVIREIIVVDDGSTDETIQAIQNYAADNTELPIILIQQENHGAACARNHGMLVATGYYIAFLDSDDMWLPNKLQIQLDLLHLNPNIDFLGGGDSDAPLVIGLKKTPKLYRASLRDMLIKSFPTTPSVIFKRSIFLEIGGFDENLRRYEDCDYWQSICAKGYGVYYYASAVCKIDTKRRFGESGLSADLKGIQKDCILSLKKKHSEGYISMIDYLTLYAFYYLKHLRRKFINYKSI